MLHWKNEGPRFARALIKSVSPRLLFNILTFWDHFGKLKIKFSKKLVPQILKQIATDTFEFLIYLLSY